MLSTLNKTNTSTISEESSIITKSNSTINQNLSAIYSENESALEEKEDNDISIEDKLLTGENTIISEDTIDNELENDQEEQSNKQNTTVKVEDLGLEKGINRNTIVESVVLDHNFTNLEDGESDPNNVPDTKLVNLGIIVDSKEVKVDVQESTSDVELNSTEIHGTKVFNETNSMYPPDEVNYDYDSKQSLNISEKTITNTSDTKKKRKKKRRKRSSSNTNENVKSMNGPNEELSEILLASDENVTTLNFDENKKTENRTNSSEPIWTERIDSLEQPPFIGLHDTNSTTKANANGLFKSVKTGTESSDALSDMNDIADMTVNEAIMFPQNEAKSMEREEIATTQIQTINKKKKKSKRSKRKGENIIEVVGDIEGTMFDSKKPKRTKKKKRSSNMQISPPQTHDSDDDDFADLMNLPETDELSIKVKEDSLEEVFDEVSFKTLLEDSDDEEQVENIKAHIPERIEVDDIIPSATKSKTSQSTIDSNISNGIRVSVVTWNLAETAPEPSDAAFLKHLVKNPQYNQNNIDAQSPDIVLIGGQECETTKPRRSEGHRSRLFRSLAVKNLGREYVPLAIHSLGGVQCLLFCHKRLHPYVEFVNVADVACGVGNVFHNKGAVGVYVQIRSKEGGSAVKILFVAAHLAAHVKNVHARNDDFWRILSELEMKSPPRFLPPKDRLELSDHRKKDERRGDLSSGADILMGDDTGYGGRHLLDSMDHIFFCGDLNYRVDLPREYTEHVLKEEKKDNIQDLLIYDQLLSAISRRDAFPDFHEGKIAFAPTFKFDKGTKTYDTSHKQRIPAWTDRILFKQRLSTQGDANGFGVNVLQYDCANEATHSDHRPVYGTFLVGMGGSRENQEEKMKMPQRKKRSKKRRSSLNLNEDK